MSCASLECFDCASSEECDYCFSPTAVTSEICTDANFCKSLGTSFSPISADQCAQSNQMPVYQLALIIVGALVALIASVALFVLCKRRRRKRRAASSSSSTSSHRRSRSTSVSTKNKKINYDDEYTLAPGALTRSNTSPHGATMNQMPSMQQMQQMNQMQMNQQMQMNNARFSVPLHHQQQQQQPQPGQMIPLHSPVNSHQQQNFGGSFNSNASSFNGGGGGGGGGSFSSAAAGGSFSSNAGGSFMSTKSSGPSEEYAAAPHILSGGTEAALQASLQHASASFNSTASHRSAGFSTTAAAATPSSPKEAVTGQYQAMTTSKEPANEQYFSPMPMNHEEKKKEEQEGVEPLPPYTLAGGEGAEESGGVYGPAPVKQGNENATKHNISNMSIVLEEAEGEYVALPSSLKTVPEEAKEKKKEAVTGAYQKFAKPSAQAAQSQQAKPNDDDQLYDEPPKHLRKNAAALPGLSLSSLSATPLSSPSSPSNSYHQPNQSNQSNPPKSPRSPRRRSSRRSSRRNSVKLAKAPSLHYG